MRHPAGRCGSNQADGSGRAGAIVRWLAIAALACARTALASPPSVMSDFDNDGFTDLAVGVPLEDLGGVEDAGVVHVIYGSASGIHPLGGPGNHLLFQHGGLPEPAEEGDQFGFALASGDFNGDAYGDLAVGIPFEDVGSVVDAGAIYVVYGSADGLDEGAGPGDHIWHQDSWSIAHIKGAAEEGDQLGYSLAVGDFNGDGIDDLAVGAPYEDVGRKGVVFPDAGVVHVFYGSASAGLHPVNGGMNQLFYQDDGSIGGALEADDRFGLALAAADFNDGQWWAGYDDLAVGVPFEDHGSVRNGGVVHVIYGSAGGLSGAGDQILHQNRPNMEGAVQDGDRFGFALAAGHFNDYMLAPGAYADLAIGVPFEDLSDGNVTVNDAGAVQVVYGSANGLDPAGARPDQLLRQGSSGIKGILEEGDHFGYALATGEFGNGGQADLAVGVPFEDLGDITDGGAVHVIFGSSWGLSGAGDQVWHQGTPGVQGAPEKGDGFGFALAAGQFNGDAWDSLAIGVPFENVKAGGVDIAGAGAIHVLYGSSAGLTASGDHLWHQDSWSLVAVADQVEVMDRFGASLGAASNFGTSTGSDRLVNVRNFEASVAGELDGVVAGYQLGILEAGEIRHAAGYGYTGLAKMTPHMRIDLGSVSKMIMTMTVLKLAELGDIDLEAPFVQYLPSGQVDPAFDPAGIHASVKGISVMELLTHTSQLGASEGGGPRSRSRGSSAAAPSSGPTGWTVRGATRTPTPSCSAT